jgi:triacylglycerol lipase
MIRWCCALLLVGCGAEVGLLPAETPEAPNVEAPTKVPSPEAEPRAAADVVVEAVPDPWRAPPTLEVAPVPDDLPIVLVHGFLGSENDFARVAEDLALAGYLAFQAQVPSMNTPEIRAGYLADRVDEVLRMTGSPKVHLIAHSMGGLDARVLISGLGYGDRVATLTTVATPHRGTNVADRVFELQGAASETIIEAFARIYGRTVDDVDQDPDFRAALTSMSKARAIDFNRDYRDDPQVRYQSWAGISDPFGNGNDQDLAECTRIEGDPLRDTLDVLLYPLAAFAAESLLDPLPNDGLVPVSSARWGVFRGCILADHADEIGLFLDRGADPRTGFDHLAFYRGIAAELWAR